MQQLKFPILVPKGCHIRMTQPYASTSDLAFYREKGITFPFHNGIDVVIEPNEGGLKTYGTPVVCPFDTGKVERLYDEKDSMSTKGNGVILSSGKVMDGDTPKMFEITFWHLSKLAPGVKEGATFKKGEVVGWMGNSGAVHPEPTPEQPWQGSHLHLMLREYRHVNGSWILKNANNGVGGNIDPLSLFNLYSFDTAADTGAANDIYPMQWAFKKRGLTEAWQQIVFAVKNWLKR